MIVLETVDDRVW